MTRLKLPVDAEKKSERALKRLSQYAAVCFWCGYGYSEFSPELEDEHFAYHCADAPKELKENAKARLPTTEPKALPEKTARRKTSTRRK